MREMKDWDLGEKVGERGMGERGKVKLDEGEGREQREVY